MPTKKVIVALLATVLLFGTVVSGCKRNRDNRDWDQSRAPAKSKRKPGRQQRNNELASVRNVRPAEVLSASAYRPPVRRQPSAPIRAERRPQYQYSQGYTTNQYQPAQYSGYRVNAPVETITPTATGYYAARTQAYEPLPEPVPVSQVASASSYYTSGTAAYGSTPATYAPATYSSQGNSSYSSGQTSGNGDRYSHLPEYAYKPARAQSAQSGYMPSLPSSRPQSPDLAMARAQLPVRTQETSARVRQVVHPQMPQPQQYEQSARYNYNRAAYSRADSVQEYNSTPSIDGVPGINPGQFAAPAPLPELEPVQYYQGVASSNRVPQITPIAPVSPAMKSTTQSYQYSQPALARAQRDSREVERALTPLSAAEETGDAIQNDWIPSAATSMYW